MLHRELVEQLAELLRLADRAADGAAWDSDAQELQRRLAELDRQVRREGVEAPAEGGV
ncbi:MAG: hypothetical protein ACO3N4_10320 [Ilumatobacteraceae bacterium]